MNTDIITYHSAEDLPDNWDTNADTPFLTKRILEILERTNPCGQQYHQARGSVFVTYRLRLDILTYSIARLKVPITILGLPMSVSSAGHSGTVNGFMVEHMKQMPGLKLILNTGKSRINDRISSGKTLPSAVFENRWHDFSGYLASLRSAYRYRITRALKRGNMFTRKMLSPDCFDNDLYCLYLNVYERSEFKLERLPVAFFQEFPGVIIRFDGNGSAAGFVQLYGHRKTLYFMFGGMDYNCVKGQDLYLNMLIEIIRYGIEHGFHFIELGQTAEEIKQKLGACPQEKHMHFFHSNPVVNSVASLLRPLLVYKSQNRSFRVFRRDV